MLANYGAFPAKSSFTHPKYIPHQADWARFRLGSKVRLIGFTVPAELHKTPHRKSGELFDKNTFYVVFLDRDHIFYLTEED
jgi:predicted component of type VI protein secretion system